MAMAGRWAPNAAPAPVVVRSARGRGGIGRHAGLRSRWGKPLGGSSPLARIGRKTLQIDAIEPRAPPTSTAASAVGNIRG